MKRVLSVFLSILMIFTVLMSLITISPKAENAIPFQFEVAELEGTLPDSNQIVKVGYYSSFTEFAHDIESYNNKGYGVEIFEKIEEVSDFKFEYIEVKGDPLDALYSGEVDLFAFHTKSENRMDEMLFSQIEYGKTFSSLVTKDSSIMYGDFTKMDGKTVATYVDNVGNERLELLCEKNGFSLEFIYGDIDTYMDLDADFYLAFSNQYIGENLNNVLDVGVYNLFLNSTFENQELMDEIDAIFYDIATTEGNFFLELEEKYLSENVEMNHRGLMPDEIATLQERPLEVGYISDYAPISYTNEEGKPDGAMVDTLSYYAERYGFEINFHAYSLDDPPENRENFDVLATVYGDGEHDREHYVTTESFYWVPMYAQVNMDLLGTISREEIMAKSPNVGILPYQTIDFAEFYEESSGTEFIIYDDWYELLDDFNSGQLEMMMSTESSSTFAELYLDNVNKATINMDVKLPVQYFVNKNIANEYLPIFNTMMDRLSESEYDAIFEANANDFLLSVDMSFEEFLKNNWYYFVLFLLILVIIFSASHAYGQIKKKQALIDSYNTEPMTGFMAPHYFREKISEILKRAKPNEYELISFDIDMFKNINTFFSSKKGSELILAVAEALKGAFTGQTVLLCRSTAEHFMIFRKVNEGGSMQYIHDVFVAPAIKESIPSSYNVYLSFGNVIIDDPKEMINTIIGQAYSARKKGKNSHKTTFVTFDKEMKKQYENMAAITFRMEQALEEKEFYIEYQPKIDFKTLKIGGAEALVRWQRDSAEKVYPDEFIQVFEENGFISKLDIYVLDEVCKFIKLNRSKMEITRISVNLSAHTILADGIVEKICDRVDNYNILPRELELELTESAVEDDTEKFLNVVKDLKSRGFAISIDDFGAGVSSLNRLSAVEADILKLDKAFFDQKDQSAKSSTVVSDVVAMANHLDMKVVAEGVETYEQALWLKRIGCDYAQGYYFARPMNDEAFKELLVSKKNYTIEE